MNLFFKRSPARGIQLQIKDLHCHMCSQTVKAVLQKVAGVNNVKVNLSQKKVKVAIADEGEVRIEFLIKALEPTGYRAKPIGTVR